MSTTQSEMKVPIRPAPPPPVNASQKANKSVTSWNGSTRVSHNKVAISIPKKKPPPRPPPPNFNNTKQEKKHIPARPSQLITSLFHKKNNVPKVGDQIPKSNSDLLDTKGNNVLSLIDFNSPPSSPTFTTRSSSDALSVNSFGSDGVTPCSTSSGNASNVESGFEDDFDFFLGPSKKPIDTKTKDPWNFTYQDHNQRINNPSPMQLQNNKVNCKNNAWVTFSSSSASKKSDLSAMPTIIRVKPEKPKLTGSEKVTNSVSTSNVNVLAEIFQNSLNTVVNTGGTPFHEEGDVCKAVDNHNNDNDDDDDDDGWSSESPPMPTCPPPAPPLEILENLLATNPEVLGLSNEKAHGIALYDFNGEHPEDLCFKINDIINLVRRVDENWFIGEMNGREGTVPANFIRVRVPLSNHNSYDRNVNALYTFQPESWEDLEFQEGSVIKVLGRINQDWLYGECNGRTGQFPANFVDRIPTDLPLRGN